MTLKLDENQQKAVEHFQGPALVVAGPGSGKTTVIKERILHLIREHNVDPEHILAIAFTNAAADEMTDRLLKEPALNHREPKICTLHVFGKDLVTKHYDLLGFSKEPDIWDEKKIGRVINQKKRLLDRETRTADVAIYKFEGVKTGRCYIGQTTDPERREREHRTYSSNRGLRDALQKGEEHFDFDVIECVKGAIAYPREKYWIDYYKNHSVFNLVPGMEQAAKNSSNVFVTIYKIQSLTDVTAYIGYTTNPEGVREIIENDGPKRFAFEIIRTEVPWTEAAIHIANEIREHKSWAVFNREDPEKARYSNQLRIEIFCQYFDVPYDKVLAHPEKFENLMERFDDLKEDIEKTKQQVNTGLFNPDKIPDPVLRAFAKRYEERKKTADAIDFLDMLIYSAHLLETHPDRHQSYRDKHRYVFVDEFQDISPIDFRLIDLFSENLFAVGDDDQAIYGFRGGDSSIMQEKFGKRGNVSHYEITRNYRSTSTIVRHAKALIEHNSARIRKNLRADNSAQSQVEVLGTPKGTIKAALLKELFNLLTTDFQKVGILARNWRGEINEIQGILKSSKLDRQGFEIDWEKLDDPWKQSDEPDRKNRRKMLLRRDKMEVEVINIHTAKGREWDKVILLVNTMYNSLPDRRNDPTNERRLFYVAVTRAKQELVILQSGNCQFIPEFQNAPPTKEEWEEAFSVELAAREPKLKIELEDTSKAALATVETRRKREVEKASKTARKQHQLNLNHLHRKVNKAENEVSEIELAFMKELETANGELLEGLMEDLIPVLDEFETQINKGLSGTDESNNVSDDFVAFTESVQLAQTQLLDLLKNHGLKPIETLSEIFNSAHHEEISPAIYSDEVPANSIAMESQRGYLLPNRVVRKAQVVVSKGREFWTPERLDWIVDRYIDRLIFEFQNKYQLGNIDRALVKLKVVQYLMELGGESVGEIDSLAVMNKRPSGHPELYANYCVAPEKTYLCNDTFRDFWKYMWKVIEQSRKTPNPKVKRVQFSVDKPPHISETQESTSVEPFQKIVNRMSIWNELATAHETGGLVKGHIIERIKGGLRVRVESLQGFLPASQVELRPIHNLEQYVGQTLNMKVIDLDRQRHNIVLSRRLWLEEQRTKLLNTLEEGQNVTGMVKNITSFGAFVDLGGLDGLLHKSEMAWQRVNHPSEIISIDEEIEVKIIKINREDEKISLSLKQMTSDPWENVEDKYPIGSKVSGVVVNIVDYGAFVQLEEGIVGLIHASEMPLVLNNMLPLDILNKGDELEVTVLKIFKDSQRISLRIK